MATHTYESMRITYQSAEQMARAFFTFAGELAARNAELEAQVARLKNDHANLVARCALLRQRPDLPVDRIPAYDELVKLQTRVALADTLAATGE